jgi:alkylated DNA repair protein (DNA oxidative demethylase)
VTAIELAPGAVHYPGYLDRAEQEALVEALRMALKASPLFTPRMPRSGKAFSVRMTNLGPLGWVSDVEGYRYQPFHPETGAPWAPMPARLLEAWVQLARGAPPPEACLVNFYDADARMGLHQDRDERELGAPVVSLSLGDTALFRFGSDSRKGPTRSIRLQSGDAFVFGGPARLAFHGVDRLYPGTSTLLPKGGRINLTLRRVTPAVDGRCNAPD